MRFLILTTFVLLCGATLGSSKLRKTESDFQKNFNIAKQHLSKREVDKAIPYLQYLLKKHPANANLKYLIGVCYAELEIVNPVTIQLLKEATSKASSEYDPNSLDEERVPIYVYYYLSVVYSQNNMCELAEKLRNTFLTVYQHNDAYYINESKRWLNVCMNMKEKPKEQPIPTFPDFEPYVSPKPKLKKVQVDLQEKNVKPDTASLAVRDTLKESSPKEIVTRKLNYTANAPLYGVQMGAFKEVIPVSRFKAMKNVDAFLDKKGWIRYVVGHFSIYSQAESLLEVIRANGYPDAFIVNVNNEKLFSDEIVSVNNVNIKANQLSGVAFKVQIGAFKEKHDLKSAELYLKIDGIKEYRDNDITFLTVGKFKTYTEAKSYALEIAELGIPDAFVVAVYGGKKIPLEHTQEFQN